MHGFQSDTRFFFLVGSLFQIFKKWYHTIGFHFYSELDRGMLNAEVPRKILLIDLAQLANDSLGFSARN